MFLKTDTYFFVSNREVKFIFMNNLQICFNVDIILLYIIRIYMNCNFKVKVLVLVEALQVYNNLVV